MDSNKHIKTLIKGSSKLDLGLANGSKPNAAECDRVHPSARQRVSDACQVPQAEPWPTDHPIAAIDRLSSQILAIDRPNFAIDRPDTLLTCQIDILTRF